MKSPGQGAGGESWGVGPDLLRVLEEARSRDLLGAMELEAQLHHALGFARAYDAAGPDSSPSRGPGRWLDLGSGGGLPGLVLAQWWPRSTAVLLDASERRTAFLSEAVHTLGWEDRVQVVRARAEDAGRSPDLRGAFDVVWARSFASPPVTAECAAPFLRLGGLLVVSEPPATTTSDSGVPDFGTPGRGTIDRTQARWLREGLAQLGLEPLVTHRARFGYQVLRQSSPCPDRFPRRAGVAAKRPLYQVGEA